MATTQRHYRMLRTIGSGGMAQVFEAVAEGESGFERRVAIKRVLPEHAHDGSMRRMFLDEARIASRFHHGNIVQVLDYGFLDDTEFLVMEYVDGVDAHRLCRQAHGMPEGIALHIVTEIAHALAYIHNLTDDEGQLLEVVHRDVSSSNILVSWGGDVKLSDFGIVFAKDREESTVTGVVKGKLRFMSPEQLLGKPLTDRADIYSLGATLHALVTGLTPGGEPGDPSRAIDPSLSEETRALIGAMMNHVPEERPAAEQVVDRAELLCSKLLRGNGRRELTGWLGALRPAFQKTSAIDRLHGIVLVPAGSDVGDREEARTYTVAERGVGEGDDASLVLAVDAEKLQGDVDRKRSRRSVFAIPTALVLLAIGAFGMYRLTGGNNQPASERDGPPENAELDPAASPPDMGRPNPTEMSAHFAESELDGEPSNETEEQRTEPATTENPPDQASASRPASPPSSDVARIRLPIAEEERADRFGWLRIGGSLQGKRVLVDGRARGVAPLELRLPIGRHTLIAVDVATGQPVMRRSVTIGEQHTRPAALRVLE